MIHNDLNHLWVVFYYCFTTQPQSYVQTHAQSVQHNYQQHTPTLTQTALGGQHLAERLTQLATGLGRQGNDQKMTKAQYTQTTRGLYEGNETNIYSSNYYIICCL